MKEVAASLFNDPDHRRAAAAIAPALLDWYDGHRRSLPWRSPPGAPADPYVVWLSEIMLQQTTVAAVKPYFAAFLAEWPTVDALAKAPLGAVLKAWAGLGYYSRARNLHACARRIVDGFGGRFPSDEQALRSLPGIGLYTAAAVAAIAFGRRAVVVDGNVERVMARLFGIETPLPQAKPLLYAAMERITPAARAGDFAQATMDLGATICTPRKPLCGLCPLRDGCRAFASAMAEVLPRKAPKKAVPRRGGAVVVIRRPDGAVMVRLRAMDGLFGGMTEFPSTEWAETFDARDAPQWPDGVNSVANTVRHVGSVTHGLTHFTLELEVYVAESDNGRLIEGARWAPFEDLPREGLPTLMRKVAALASGATGAPSPATFDKRDLRTARSLPLLDGLIPTHPRRPAPEPDGSRRHRMPRQERRRRLP